MKIFKILLITKAKRDAYINTSRYFTNAAEKKLNEKNNKYVDKSINKDEIVEGEIDRSIQKIGEYAKDEKITNYVSLRKLSQKFIAENNDPELGYTNTPMGVLKLALNDDCSLKTLKEITDFTNKKISSLAKNKNYTNEDIRQQEMSFLKEAAAQLKVSLYIDAIASGEEQQFLNENINDKYTMEMLQDDIDTARAAFDRRKHEKEEDVRDASNKIAIENPTNQAKAQAMEDDSIKAIENGDYLNTSITVEGDKEVKTLGDYLRKLNVFKKKEPIVHMTDEEIYTELKKLAMVFEV